MAVMRPSCVVLSYNSAGHLLYDLAGQLYGYYFFYNNVNAIRALVEAKKQGPNANGAYSLYSEDGRSCLGIPNPEKVRLVYFFDLQTTVDPSRIGFLNLESSEIDELAQKLGVPPEIIKAASNEEKLNSEYDYANKRARLRHKYSTTTLKLMERLGMYE